MWVRIGSMFLLVEQVVLSEPGGVLTASAYDNTIRGYTTMVCRDVEEPSEASGFPLTMPSPKLHLYALDAAAPSAEPTLIFDIKDRAVRSTRIPFVAGDLPRSHDRELRVPVSCDRRRDVVRSAHALASPLDLARRRTRRSPDPRVW
jgi:hypothetical protein